jgi:hypothetical protein
MSSASSRSPPLTSGSRVSPDGIDDDAPGALAAVCSCQSVRRSVGPVARAARRAIEFSSWRTLPGHEAWPMASTSAGSMARTPVPNLSP